MVRAVYEGGMGDHWACQGCGAFLPDWGRECECLELSLVRVQSDQRIAEILHDTGGTSGQIELEFELNEIRPDGLMSSLPVLWTPLLKILRARIGRLTRTSSLSPVEASGSSY